MENFTPIRNGIRAHIQKGALSPFDLGVYLFLHLGADWKTGIYEGCALTIAFGFGDSRLKEHIQQSLRRLRDRQYINYRKGDGGRSGYPILINKYEPTKGELMGTRLNAWKHGDSVKSEYEQKNCDATVVPQSSHRDETVTTPSQDLTKTLRDRKINSTPRIVPHPLRDDFQPIENHWKLASELGIDLAQTLDAFRDFHGSKGSTFRDWDKALNTWLRREHKFAKESGNGRGAPKQLSNSLPETYVSASEQIRLERKVLVGAQ